LVTTLYVVLYFFNFVDNILPKSLHSVFSFVPEDWPPFLGAILVVVIAYFVGVGAKNYFGRLIIDTGNAIIANIPLMNKIYLGVQQVIDAAAGANKKLFEKAVLIQYPKKDSYCIAFVTSHASGEIPAKAGRPMLSVFVPTTPNPTSGFLLYVPEAEVIELEMNVETAVKTVMSAGMVNPDQLKQTNDMYTIPRQLKKWNWTRIFRRGAKRDDISLDPRD
jgi:uncharacterized membrane protein